MERKRWQHYSSAVYCDVLDEKSNYPIAIKPASKKGASGWTKLPKIQPEKICNGRQQAFSYCLSSSIPIHLHTNKTHPGRCLKTVPDRWVLKDSPHSLSSKFV